MRTPYLTDSTIEFIKDGHLLSHIKKKSPGR